MNNEDKITLGRVGQEQFVVAEYRLLDSELIGSDEKILYLMLLRFKNKSQAYCYPSLQTLEDRLGWSRKTLLLKLNNLIEVGLIKKISSRNPKQNNQYVIYPVDVVLGGKQLSIQDLTEDEVEMLDEMPEGQIIKNEKTGKIMICASEKLAFYLRAIQRRIENFAETIKGSASFEETSLVIETIQRFYEGIASCPIVRLDKRITDDCDKMSSEDYLEQVSKFDFESIVEIVRKVKEEGIPKQFENVSEQIYILSYLWAKRSVILSNALAIRIEEVAKSVKPEVAN